MAAAEQKLRQILEALREPNSAEQAQNIGIMMSKKWFQQQFDIGTNNNSSKAKKKTPESSHHCTVETFAIYFMGKIRTEITQHLKQSECETPKSLTPVRKPATNRRAASNNTRPFGPLNDEERFEMSFDKPGHNENNGGSGISLDYLCGYPPESTFSSTPVRRNQYQTPPQQQQQQHQHHSQQRRSGNSLNYSQHNNSSYNASTSQQNTGSKSRQHHHANNSGPSPSASFNLGDFLLSSPALNNRISKKKQQQQQHKETPPPPPSQQQQQQQHSKKRVALITEKRQITLDTSIGNNNQLPLQLNSTSFGANSNNSSICSPSNKVTTSTAGGIENVANPQPLQQQQPLLLVSQIDLTNITQRALLEKLACIHSMLIDLNLCLSVLNEIAFLLSLLNNQASVGGTPLTATSNANAELANQLISALQKIQVKTPANEKSPISLAFAKSYPNCVYFALCVLRRQRHLLSMLDLKSLDAVMQIDSLQHLASDLQQYLMQMLQQKQHSEAQAIGISLNRNTRYFKKVYFHEEQDTRRCFPSNNEFGAFKTQRDLFYDALKLWETQHVKPTWNFQQQLAPKVAEIFRESENPINMSHFSKLFVAQLLISSLEATSPEEIRLKLDDIKLSKLTQRMIGPGTFSTDYQFPRSQAFFRDFILASRSVSFMEQLKIALYLQLITLNNSSIEQQSVHANEEDDAALAEANAAGDAMATAATAAAAGAGDQLAATNMPRHEYIVRPDVLASMLMLAKFLGFVQSLPFHMSSNENGEINLAANIEQEQLKLRSVFQPNFDVCKLLEQAIEERKLLITLPWLVQYLVMLDNVSLQLSNTAAALKTMYGLYIDLGISGKRGLQLLPISAFIARCCIGWLCEKRSLITEQYYAYRTAHMQRHGEHDKFLLALEEDEGFDDEQLVIGAKATANASTNPLLESLINVACPFLSEFRVAIKPSVFTRTGNYRHIATRIYELPSQQVDSSDAAIAMSKLHMSDMSAALRGEKLHNRAIDNLEQSKLIEVFVQSQTPSIRTMIEYVIERTYRATVKDAQQQILLPSKAAADAEVNKITSSKQGMVTRAVEHIYGTAMDQALKDWDETMPEVLSRRVKQTLDGLLPDNTMPIVKQTYIELIERSAAQKMMQWRTDNMLQNNFYCNNYYEMVRKICRANSRELVVPVSNTLRLQPETKPISILLDRLQYYLHCSTMRTDIAITSSELIKLCHELLAVFDNVLPALYYRLVGAYLLELMQRIITEQPAVISTRLVDAVCQVWLHPKMRFCVQSKHRKGEDMPPEIDPCRQLSLGQDLPSIFHLLIPSDLIAAMRARRESYQALQKLLVGLIIQHVISVDYINLCFFSIFKEEWPQITLSLISELLMAVVKKTANMAETPKGTVLCDVFEEEEEHQQQQENEAAVDADDEEAAAAAQRADAEFNEAMTNEKSHLIMEVLADLARDADNF